MQGVRSIVVSIVSHNHAKLVASLLKDIDLYCQELPVTVIVTVNVEEALPFSEDDFGFPLKVIHNRQPKGFGANHNAAFWAAEGDVFCVLNPDIRLGENPFPRLLENLGDKRCGIIAPLVLSPTDFIEDNARRFPTPLSILGKALSIKRDLDYAIGQDPLSVDWVAGMFMLFPGRVFAELGGFDTRYFLYYEDVDLCFRARTAGYDVVLDPRATVMHEARRESHRSPSYLRWHLGSMFKFFLSRSLTAKRWAPPYKDP